MSGDLVVDFVGGALGHRRRFGGGRGQAIARAAGLVRGATPDIVDATAGLGRDAFILASLGARVTLIERVAAVHDRLAEAMAHAREADAELAAIIDRMTLLHGDARELLPTLTPEVVLVDPMHPDRGNSALVKQEMRLLRQVVGDDPDGAELLAVALATASRRVVLKWPRRAPLPAGIRDPSYSLDGRSTRYEVFVTA